MLKRFWNWLTSDEPTRYEQELQRRIDYLEIELHKAREQYREVMERIAFPPAYPIVPESGPFQSVPNNKVQAEAHRLSQLSKQRLAEQIVEMESRAASISSRDEKLSREAHAQKETAGPSEFEERF